jgi:hypothetical protein
MKEEYNEHPMYISPLLWSAKEERLIYEHESQPYMDQWWNETSGFQVVEPGRGPISSATTGVVNGLGKLFVGATTIIDRSIDQVTNPREPEQLRSGDLLPRTQRDTRQLLKGIFSTEALKHPIGTIIASGMRVINIGTSLVTDGVQKLGGGKNLAV